MWQKFQAIGNLGSEVEMRFLDSGTKVANFSLAINNKFKTKGGELRESTLWVRVTVWEIQAEHCAQYLHKGSKVFIEGELKPANAYMNKSGEPAASIEVTAQTIKFLDAKPQDATSHTNTTQAPQANRVAEADIPF